MQNVTEQLEIEQALRGDAAAFRFVVETYKERAFSLAIRMLKDHDQAEDAVQDAFIRTYKSLSTFRGDSQFSTWFYRIVYTTCLNVLRSQRRLPGIDSLDEETTPAVWVEPEIFEALDRTLVESVLQEELTKMPSTYSAVMDLFYVKDCSYEVIVRVTGMPLGTVKAKLNRGRGLLREALLARLPELRQLFEERWQ